VILLEETREAKVPGIDEMRSQLQRVATSKMIESNIEELRKSAAIDIKDKKEAPATSEPATAETTAPAS
jgi:parvulin-like peptidyl-prolyl isomerase